MTRQAEAPVFDAHAGDYDQSLERGLCLSGENKDYFARRRLQWLRHYLGAESEVGRVLDYGCGTGSATPWFFESLHAAEVVGVDVSESSIAVARERHGSQQARFHTRTAFPPRADFDLAFCNGVFHHIEPTQRPTAIREVAGYLRPGGYFAFWENNPWNPGTHWVMRRIPFDADARKIFPHRARRLLRESGFAILSVSFAFIFPRWLSALRPLELPLSRIPLGAQYQVLCRREE